MNVFSNFVPNKTITCRDKDPPWITEEVKKLCHMKTKIYENYIKNGCSDADKDELIKVTSISSDASIKAKENFFSTVVNFMNFSPIRSKNKFCLYIFNKKCCPIFFDENKKKFAQTF